MNIILVLEGLINHYNAEPEKILHQSKSIITSLIYGVY